MHVLFMAPLHVHKWLQYTYNNKKTQEENNYGHLVKSLQTGGPHVAMFRPDWQLSQAPPCRQFREQLICQLSSSVLTSPQKSSRVQ